MSSKPVIPLDATKKYEPQENTDKIRKKKKPILESKAVGVAACIFLVVIILNCVSGVFYTKQFQEKVDPQESSVIYYTTAIGRESCVVGISNNVVVTQNDATQSLDSRIDRIITANEFWGRGHGAVVLKTGQVIWWLQSRSYSQRSSREWVNDYVTNSLMITGPRNPTDTSQYKEWMECATSTTAENLECANEDTVALTLADYTFPEDFRDSNFTNDVFTRAMDWFDTNPFITLNDDGWYVQASDVVDTEAVQAYYCDLKKLTSSYCQVTQSLVLSHLSESAAQNTEAAAWVEYQTLGAINVNTGDVVGPAGTSYVTYDRDDITVTWKAIDLWQQNTFFKDGTIGICSGNVRQMSIGTKPSYPMNLIGFQLILSIAMFAAAARSWGNKISLTQCATIASWNSMKSSLVSLISIQVLIALYVNRHAEWLTIEKQDDVYVLLRETMYGALLAMMLSRMRYATKCNPATRIVTTITGTTVWVISRKLLMKTAILDHLVADADYCGHRGFECLDIDSFRIILGHIVYPLIFTLFGVLAGSVIDMYLYTRRNKARGLETLKRIPLACFEVHCLGCTVQEFLLVDCEGYTDAQDNGKPMVQLDYVAYCGYAKVGAFCVRNRDYIYALFVKYLPKDSLNFANITLTYFALEDNHVSKASCTPIWNSHLKSLSKSHVKTLDGLATIKDEEKES